MNEQTQQRILEYVRQLLQHPYPLICRHAVASDLLSLLEEQGYAVSDELAGAVVRADDRVALGLLSGREG